MPALTPRSSPAFASRRDDVGKKVVALSRDEAPAAPAPASPSQVQEPLTNLRDVSSRAGIAPLAERLEQLQAWLSPDFAALEEALLHHEQERDLGHAGFHKTRGHVALPATSSVQRAATHLLQRPGKRIRPLCVVLAAKLGNRAFDACVKDVAVAVELVHAATLLHDDVIDDSQERRGAQAARIIYGNSASILAGDHLLVQALTRVRKVDDLRLLDALLVVVGRMVAAEAMQLQRRGNFAPDENAYREVVDGKTASLFIWGLSAGAQLGGLPQHQVVLLEQVGKHLGLAFQLVDDILDVEGDSAVTGKPKLQDVREGKLTWPAIIACQHDPTLAQALSLVAQGVPKANSQDFLDDIVNRMHKTGALTQTRAFANQQAEEAQALLKNLPANQARDALSYVVASAIHRLR